MKKKRLVVTLVSLGLVVGGGFLAKYVEMSAGLTLVTAGGFGLGWLRKQLLPSSDSAIVDKAKQ